MVLKCQVNLDNPKGVYEPGDKLIGHVILTLEVRLLIKATARIIERGIYTYPFTVTLPQSCPSTFESANGHIRYMLEVFVDHKNKREVWYTQQLQVLKPLDLRQCPQIAAQARNVLVDEGILWHFFKHPMKMCVNLQQFGFVPGEALSIHVSIQNPDNLRLHELSYELQQICRITASHGHNKTKTKYFHTTLAKAVHTICGPPVASVQHLQELYMPQTVPSTDPDDCHCLQISYELSVRLSTDNVKRSVHAKIPIVVGTVSLRSAEEARTLPSLFQAGVFSTCSMENLSSKASECNRSPIVEVPDNFAMATAPEPESPIQNVLQLNLGSSSFREASHLPKTKFDAEPKKSKHTKEQIDFKPTYLYYDIDNMSGVRNDAAITTTTTENTTTTTVPSATESPQQNDIEAQNSENRAYAGVVQQLRAMQERNSIVNGSS
ncbi:arrestin domain-containing protein 17 isoform X2 [Zeugodacus cucurbitae]|uniref:arrestin domain-containing protein 17 isoform X2 n=1 Tax=Zeugodacus cucurbitae TaxID=28588 RepID=UPI0023D8E23C|nr:arrestin domain-containing protein 17 isoform X2 [Zeugodacus cucurbitae]